MALLCWLDLKAPSFQPGKKLYDRVQWCLRRAGDATLLCAWHADGSPLPSPKAAFPASWQVAWHEAPPKGASLAGVLVPSSPASADPAALNEWAGLLAARAGSVGAGPRIAVDDGWAEFVSVAGPPEGLELERCDGQSVVWEGFLAAPFLCHVVERLREAVDAGRAPWAMLCSWGFDDAPLSWGDCEHGYRVSGENDLVLFVLPGGATRCVCSFGPLDAYPGP
eukprot:m51a1_g12938 hypothetical protein (223) ;mRNA; r:2104-2984